MISLVSVPNLFEKFPKQEIELVPSQQPAQSEKKRPAKSIPYMKIYEIMHFGVSVDLAKSVNNDKTHSVHELNSVVLGLSREGRRYFVKGKRILFGANISFICTTC